LATGEAEAAWMALNGPPLGPARDPFQRPAGPGADVELDEPALDAEGETARPGDGGRGLTRALERRGVDRRDLRERGEAPRDGVRLAPPLVREVQPLRSTREDRPRRRGKRVADEEHARRRRVPAAAALAVGLQRDAGTVGRVGLEDLLEPAHGAPRVARRRGPE